MNIQNTVATPAKSVPLPDHAYVLWAMLAFSALHMVEEYAFDWPAWLRSVGIACSETDMYVMNLAFFAIGICAAIVGWLAPGFSLCYPALLLLNAVFHIVATLIYGRLNPGTITAVTLFLPLATYCFVVAAKDGVLGRRQIVWAFVIGLFIHAFPAFTIYMRSRLSYY